MTEERRRYAGVNWASESHHVFLTDDRGAKVGKRIFQHSGEGLAEMAAWLHSDRGDRAGAESTTLPWRRSRRLGQCYTSVTGKNERILAAVAVREHRSARLKPKRWWPPSTAFGVETFIDISRLQ
jgi:hypothetical protein